MQCMSKFLSTVKYIGDGDGKTRSAPIRVAKGTGSTTSGLPFTGLGETSGSDIEALLDRVPPRRSHAKLPVSADRLGAAPSAAPACRSPARLCRTGLNSSISGNVYYFQTRRR